MAIIKSIRRTTSSVATTTVTAAETLQVALDVTKTAVTLGGAMVDDMLVEYKLEADIRKLSHEQDMLQQKRDLEMEQMVAEIAYLKQMKKLKAELAEVGV